MMASSSAMTIVVTRRLYVSSGFGARQTIEQHVLLALQVENRLSERAQVRGKGGGVALRFAVFGLGVRRLGHHRPKFALLRLFRQHVELFARKTLFLGELAQRRGVALQTVTHQAL